MTGRPAPSRRERAVLPDAYRADKAIVNDRQRLERDGRVHLFTDGSANARKKTGGWGFVMICGDRELQSSGAEAATSIGAMELRAIYEGLSRLKPTRRDVIVYSDSEYVVNALTVWHRSWAARGWVLSTGKPVKHVELIKSIVALAELHRATFRWVRGHSGNWGNEIADQLAKAARYALQSDDAAVVLDDLTSTD